MKTILAGLASLGLALAAAAPVWPAEPPARVLDPTPDRPLVHTAEFLTNVTHSMNVPFDTTVHCIAVHLHPFAESLELRDLTTGETLYHSEARPVPLRPRQGVQGLPHRHRFGVTGKPPRSSPESRGTLPGDGQPISLADGPLPG